MLDVIFENIADFIQRRLEEACEDIKIAVAWFTNEELFNSLLAALNRGVTVSIVILDDTINRNELALDYSKFIEAGGRLYFSRNRKMHNKFVIVDSKFVLTGSYNWTYYAENLNWENVLSTDDFEIVSKYAKEYNQICQTLKEEKVYVPIRFSELGNEQLYDNYAYLSNDLNLKSKHTKELIERINRENHRNVAIEKIAREQNFDYRGIPKLQKELSPRELKKRLINIYINSVPSNMPNSNHKYILAELTSNSIWIEDTWVHIIDEEYIEEMRLYFHKRDGGLLDDNAPLPPIPADLYTPKGKYKFREVKCDFKGGKEHLKYDSQGNLLRYKYKEFHLYTRIGESPRDYVGYGSLKEQFEFIVMSLFHPNNIEDIEPIPACQNGVVRGHIDDLYFLDEFVKDYIERNEIKDTSIQNDFKINPKGFWFKWESRKIVALLFVGFINHLDIEPNDFISMNLSEKGEWFLIKYCCPLSKFEHYQHLREFVENLKTKLKHDETKGILTIWYNDDIIHYKSALLSLGFREEPLRHVWKGNLNKECAQYRLTF